MNTNTQIHLPDRYEVLRPLGSGSFSTVYLVRHQFLELERAVKVIPKTSTGQLSVLHEAKLLTSLQHPGIPRVFDIEEDATNFYLVEEYIQGESLDEFLLHQTSISQNCFFEYCDQICDIFIYLHTALPFPVLYQDLKPEHIIVCLNQLKLIDFGATVSLSSSGNNFKRFGNIDFSAPENYLNGTLSTRADIFTIGKFINYLSNFIEPPVPAKITQIIQKATNPEPTLRYETVEELRFAIQQISNAHRQPHLFENVAVIGSHSGCGVTHFSIAMTSTLNALGYRACYFEKNDTRQMHAMKETLPGVREQEGYLYYKWFTGLPQYGPGLCIKEKKFEINIYDLGFDFSKLAAFPYDRILFLCSDSPWHWKQAFEEKSLLIPYRDILSIICNPGCSNAARTYARFFGIPVYSYFVDSAPFQLSQKKTAFMLQLLNQKGRVSLFSIAKRLLGKFQKQ